LLVAEEQAIRGAVHVIYLTESVKCDCSYDSDNAFMNIFKRLFIPDACGICVGADLNQKAVENFVQEGIIMKNFNHPHVLSLLGLCLGHKKEPMVVLPFMANGDLRSFVKDKSRVSGYLLSASM